MLRVRGSVPVLVLCAPAAVKAFCSGVRGSLELAGAGTGEAGPVLEGGGNETRPGKGNGNWVQEPRAAEKK